MNFFQKNWNQSFSVIFQRDFNESSTYLWDHMYLKQSLVRINPVVFLDIRFKNVNKLCFWKKEMYRLSNLVDFWIYLVQGMDSISRRACIFFFFANFRLIKSRELPRNNLFVWSFVAPKNTTIPFTM